MNEYIIIIIEICFAVHRALPSAGLGAGEGSPGLAPLKQFYSAGFLKEIIDWAGAQITDTSVGMIFFSPVLCNNKLLYGARLCTWAE